MLMIRFQRIGRRNDPAFRILVLEKTASPKAGTYADLIGTYNPRTKAFTLDADKLTSWIAKGAQVSPSLKNLLISKGILTGAKSSAVVKQKNLTKNVQAEVPAESAPVEAAEASAEEAAPADAASAETPAEEAVAEAAA